MYRAVFKKKMLRKTEVKGSDRAPITSISVFQSKKDKGARGWDLFFITLYMYRRKLMSLSSSLKRANPQSRKQNDFVDIIVYFLLLDIIVCFLLH